MINDKVFKLAHFGYIVKDIDSSIYFFNKILDIKDFYIYDFKPIKAWVNGNEINDCFFKIGMGSIGNDLKIELIKPISGEMTPHIKLARKGESNLHHIAFQVSNYLYWRKHFIENLKAKIIFEAEVEDEVIGYRRSFYAIINNKVGIIEIAEIPHKRKLKNKNKI
jgi:catechol 2,3-dioxygenase-like lactoylglutathione lyase family enzyme